MLLYENILMYDNVPEKLLKFLPLCGYLMASE